MNRDILERMKKAKEYQRLAILSLFPENMTGHVEVIEKELTSMFMECIMNFWKEDVMSGYRSCYSGDYADTSADASIYDETKQRKEESKSNTKCRKVHID